MRPVDERWAWAMTSPLLVASREVACIVGPLGMRCESTEMPSPLDDAEAVLGRWIGVSQFTGEAQRYSDAGNRQPQPTTATTVEGSVALTLTDDRLLVIVAPPTTDLAVWISAGARELAIEPIGTEGVFKKRPRMVGVSTPTWRLHLGMASEVIGSFAKPNQNGALLERLAKARTKS